MAVVWFSAARVLAAWLGRGDPEPAEVEPIETVDPTMCPHADAIAALDRRPWIRHVVVPRERLDQIAARYDVSLDELNEWNGLSGRYERLRTGTRLRVRARRMPPVRERVEHVVVEGDEWWSIAQRHGTTSGDLRATNWPHRDKLKPGKPVVVWSDPVVRAWVERDDGTLDVPNGGVGVGPPDDGWLLGGVHLPQSEGWELRQPAYAYGTTHAVREIARALDRYARDGGPRLDVGAMSRQSGGPIAAHRSHQTGRDLDIALPRRSGLSRILPLTNHRIDWLALWRLLESLAQSDVAVIWLDYGRQARLYKAARKAGIDRERLGKLLQYPMGTRSSALVRHADGHDQHLHVRVRCGPCEPECVDRRGELVPD